jgi:hypothetical protein
VVPGRTLEGRVTDPEDTMRLSEWRAAAPHRDAAGPKVSAVVDPVLDALGAGPDPHAWFMWSDDASARYTILVPTDAGLIVAFVRPLVPGEGPRASAKLVRWSRVAIGELGVESQAGHRLLSFQVEQQVLRGVDAEADQVAEFALRVIAAVDGKPLPAGTETPKRRGSRAPKGAARSLPGGVKATARSSTTSPRAASSNSMGPKAESPKRQPTDRVPASAGKTPRTVTRPRNGPTSAR